MDNWAAYSEVVSSWIDEFRAKCKEINFDSTDLSDYIIETQIMGSINNHPHIVAAEYVESHSA